MSTKKIQVEKFFAEEALIGARADKALATLPRIHSRSKAADMIEKQQIQINGKAVKASYVIKAHDEIEITWPEDEPVDLQPLDLSLDILFEDEDLIVINKPAGLVVHPSAGHSQDTLVNALLNHTQDLSMKNQIRPGIVHRLDKETSGVLVVAKNDISHEKLAAQFKDRTIHRIYFAVVLGDLKNKRGTVQSYIARHPRDRKRMASVLDKRTKKIIHKKQVEDEVLGKWAVTHYEVLKQSGPLSYLKVKLETGRTHQIRVHLSEQGNPLVGDTLYGADKKTKILEKEQKNQILELNRFLLHAAELGFVHPRTEEKLFYAVEWPAEMQKLIKLWGLG